MGELEHFRGLPVVPGITEKGVYLFIYLFVYLVYLFIKILSDVWYPMVSTVGSMLY